jgi:transcriptional regulator with XRE-family HTH domain
MIIKKKKDLTVSRLQKPRFGKLQRTLRERRGLSLRDLAIEAGVDRSYIYQIETGKVGVPAGRISMAIARALDSLELQELAEWSLVRELHLIEAQRLQSYLDMPAQLRAELGIKDAEVNQIKDTTLDMLSKFLAATERREKPSERKRLGPTEAKKQRLIASLGHCVAAYSTVKCACR